MSNSKKVPMSLTNEQSNQLIAQGVTIEMFDILEVSELLELLEASKKQSLTIRVKSQRTNTCTELVDSFKNADVIVMTKEELTEKILIMNQEAFFTITKNSLPFLLTKSSTVKMFTILKNYNFKNEADNKHTQDAVTEANKVKVSIGQWLSRGGNKMKTLIKNDVSTSFNGYKLGYKVTVDGQVVTFKRDTQEAK